MLFGLAAHQSVPSPVILLHLLLPLQLLFLCMLLSPLWQKCFPLAAQPQRLKEREREGEQMLSQQICLFTFPPLSPFFPFFFRLPFSALLLSDSCLRSFLFAHLKKINYILLLLISAPLVFEQPPLQILTTKLQFSSSRSPTLILAIFSVTGKSRMQI